MFETTMTVLLAKLSTLIQAASVPLI